jgi:hypothetical protein
MITDDKYIKIVYDGMVYYINAIYKDDVTDAFGFREHRLAQFSDYIVNKNENKLIKCRSLIEHLIDSKLKI